MIGIGNKPASNEKKESAIKPVFLSILAFFILTLVSNVSLKLGIPFLDVGARIYLYPFQHLTFSETNWNLTAGVVVTLLSFVFFAFISNLRTKVLYYSTGLILVYLVYLGIWYFGVVMVKSFSQITAGSVFASIVPLAASLFLIVAVFVIHLILAADKYEEYFIKESESFRKRVESEKERHEGKIRLKKINEEKRKTKEQTEFTPITKRKKDEKKPILTKSGPGKSFEENKELADKIRQQMKNAAVNKKLSFDTNILIKCPLLVKELSKKYEIVLSKKVFEELDKKKTDKDIGSNARMAMRTIESIQIGTGNLSIVSIDEHFITENGLNINSPDDIIIACCLKQEKIGEDILFISEDRGARITARNMNIDVLNF